MRPVLTAAQMRDADRRTIEEIGLPGAVLMENAGAAVARAVRQRFPGARTISVLCGKGNNGGDGFVAARWLRALAAEAYLLGSRPDVKGDARLHMGVFERGGGRTIEVPDEQRWEEVRAAALGADVVVDAVLGTGLRQAPSGLAARVIEELSERDRIPPVVAVDVPSGIGSDGGELAWPVVAATVTVTLAALKHGHVLPPACGRVGTVEVAEIGIPAEVIAGTHPSLWLLDETDAAVAYPPRAPDSHKGTYGHVLVVAGSVGKTGAAVLAATGALAAGAGLVTVATAEPALPMVATARPELMTEPLASTGAGTIARDAVERALALAKTRDAVVVGPGVGQDGSTREFVRELVRRCPVPLVVDADGLNALAPSGPRVPAATDALRRDPATVVTPHPGEMARLVGVSSGEIQRRRLESARALATQSGAVVVLKGYRTIVADRDGRAAVNPTGNAGMATGGTGDVLSGIAGALLARGLDGWTAATAAAYVHGLAGDVAAAEIGQESMLAGDLVASLPRAIRRLGPSHS
jgi:ADP-dependent NAD(P)H-hydrate dehydratase / NAD(P)H-hydrate epimerase